MSPEVKVLDDYLTNGNSNNDSVLKQNNNDGSCSIHLSPQQIGRTVRNSSPVSDNSQNISIVSLDENDIDSSIASDSDLDDDFPPKDAQYIIEKLVHGNAKASSSDPTNNSNGVIVVSQNLRNEAIAANRPQIGSIAVQNSSDITFGDKTFYTGPVTIKKFFLDDSHRWRPSNGSNDNPTFQNSNGNVNSSSLDGKKDSTDCKPKEPLTFKTILKKYKKYVILNVVGLLLLLFVIIGLVLAFGSRTKYMDNSGDGDQNIKPNKDSNISATLPHSVSKLRLVTRDEWIAQPPDNKLTMLELPVNRVIIQHSATEGCDTQAQCVYRVRLMQTYHMESKHWDDIGYNFLVGGDGAVYEGRGWDYQGAHTKGYNDGSFGIAFIGTFTRHTPPQRQFDALRLILEESVRSGKLTKDYKMYPHRAFFGTESPGDKVIEVLKTWPHYVGTFED